VSILEIRGLFARCLLGDISSAPNSSIGSILLRPHQQSAVTRVGAAIDEFGGALVSDHVGTGKTYVALAFAARYGSATVVAPAVLKDMWIAAASNAGATITFVSTESLSRRALPNAGPEVGTLESIVIVDEAQHFRNPATRRFAALAGVCSSRPVVLLSATPIHNRRRDLETLLSIFMGSRSATLSSSEMGRAVIRRSRDDIGDSAAMPEVTPPQWCNLTHDDEIPELLLSLPPPLGPRNGGDGGALVVHSLIRQWVSSDAALHRALVRRLQRATALIAALEAGTYPTESDLSAWISGEDCVQLGFAELLSAGCMDSADLLPVVRRHMAAVQSLALRLKTTNRRDSERADIIRELRQRHKGVGIVAFSQYSDTVEALFDLIAPDGSVAVLTGSAARVFGGRISRAEAIARFAPEASGRKAPRPADAVTLLLTTDILSEGVNLQDAGVVIHLDLPWTPARLEQRVGRIARIGSRHERVFCYALRPPASGDALIRTETILRTKMASAGIVADSIQSTLPGGIASTDEKSLPRLVEDVRAILESWSSDVTRRFDGELAASAVIADVSGFLALCRIGGRYRVLTSDTQGVTDDPAHVLAMMQRARGEEAGVDLSDLANAIDSITRYVEAARAVGSGSSPVHSRQIVKRAALRRIARIARHARPHERAFLIPASSRARAAVVGRLSAGQETRIAELSVAQMSESEWLRQVAEISEAISGRADPDEIIAMILLRSIPLSKRDTCNKTLPDCV
jgi:hypothetical protein